MASEIVRQGQAAWRRLKRGNKTWDDWKAVGRALLEGRAIAMHNAAPRVRLAGVIPAPSMTGSLTTGSR